MPRSGGVYSLPNGSLAVDGQTATASTHNTPIQDLETDANTARPVSAGGTGATTAAAARVALGVRTIKAVDTGGSADTYTLTSGDSLTPSDGDAVLVICSATNTGASTLNVDSTGAADLKKMVEGTATALAAGDFVAGHHYLMSYDSGESAWLLHDPSTISVSDITSSGDVTVADAIIHNGDTNNKIALGTDTQDFQTGGSSRLDISDSGVRLGAANARVTTILDEDDMVTDSATALATQQSIKAYVDSSTSGGLALTSVGPTSTASGTAVDWTSIPTGAKRIIIFLNAVEGGSGKLLVQIGDSGGIETTGYSSIVHAMSVGSTSSTSGFIIEHSGANGAESGIIIMTREDSANNGWGYQSTVCSANNYAQHGAGAKDLSAELDRVRLTTTTGSTFTAGTATLTYEI